MKWFDKITRWDSISKIGKNRVVKSSYFWLVFIPIVAKILNGVETPIKFLFDSGYSLELNLLLPFSWKIFFVSAVLISIANILYLIFCPKLIQENKGYSDYYNSGKMAFQLLDNLPFNDTKRADFLDENLSKIREIKNGNEDIDVKQFKLKDYTSSIFWSLWNDLRITFFYVRGSCWLLYWAGILLFVSTIVQNIYFVFNNFIFN